MESLPKGALPFFGLAAVTVYVFVCQRLFKQANKPKHFPMFVLFICLAIFVFAAFSAQKTNFPSQLSATNTEIIQQKLHQRELCRSALKRGDETGAEDAILDSSLSKELARKGREQGRKSMAKIFQKVFEPVAFGAFGAMYSAVPLFVVMLALLNKNLTWHYQSHLETVMPIALPLTVAAGIITYIGFFGIIQPLQSSRCIRTSGHWYTYTVTSYWLLVVSGHLLVRNVTLASMYLVWVAIYQMVSLQVLTTTQLYFHDEPEALEGIMYGCIAVIFESGVFYALVKSVACTVIEKPWSFEEILQMQGSKPGGGNEEEEEETGEEEGQSLKRNDSFEETEAKVVMNHKANPDASQQEVHIRTGQRVVLLSESLNSKMAEIQISGLIPTWSIEENPDSDTGVAQKQATVIENFEAEADTELTVSKGDLVFVVQPGEEGWVEVMVRGWVPSRCLQLL